MGVKVRIYYSTYPLEERYREKDKFVDVVMPDTKAYPDSLEAQVIVDDRIVLTRPVRLAPYA